jgi:hypothetical protein
MDKYTVRVGLDPRSSHAQRQSTFPDNVCSYYPPCDVVSHHENLTTFLFFCKFFFNPQESALALLCCSTFGCTSVQKWSRVMKKRIRERVTKGKRGRTDLRGSLLDTTMIDLMWAKQVP